MSNNKIKVWVQFINIDSYERCYRYTSAVWQLLFPVKVNHGWISGPVYNNIEIKYPHWGDNVYSETQRNWGAATVNNEVQIYKDFFPDLPIPSILDVYLIPQESSGAAIMNTVWYTPFPELKPDLSIGINKSTRFKQDKLSYHEIAHASHYYKMGLGWWSFLTQQEIENSIEISETTFTFEGDPHGQGGPNETHAGKVALAESWADYVMSTIMGLNQENEIFENGYIPTGLHHDLSDTNEDTVNGIKDRVSGFTRMDMFSVFNPTINDLEDYETALEGLLPSGNTITDYQNLFGAYQQ